MKFISVNMVLAAFTFLEGLLRRIQKDRDAQAGALDAQIASLRFQQTVAANEADRAGRVARKLAELTS